MNVVFVTTCKGRVQHIARTLPQNMIDNPDAKFVVLDYNDQDGGLLEYLKSNHAHDIESGRLVVYQYREPCQFHMTHAKNMAHRLGILEGGDILVNLDADNFTGPGFAEYVEKKFKNSTDIFLWSRMVKEGNQRLVRGVSGRIAVTREAFILAGGYDEKYDTHSPDDKDFNARLRKLGFEGWKIDSRFLLAIRHTDKLRYREYPHAANVIAEDFDIKPDAAVVNAGNIGCGLVWRNFSAFPIYVSPVATRIFGIGMHKTATTSLSVALQKLGYKTEHWPSAHWAKAIWREMNETGRSPTLEKCYAATDLPITLMFRKLDVAYPGSKFILTIRNEATWLESVRKHWSPEYNEFRAGWDNDPFTNRIHQVLYGRTDFDPVIFLERYRRHNAHVLEYFKTRPSDLMVMDMDRKHGWKELCGFLNIPIPAESYPKAYAYPAKGGRSDEKGKASETLIHGGGCGDGGVPTVFDP